jgi:hypothetical protein
VIALGCAFRRTAVNPSVQPAQAPDAIERAADVAATIFSVLVYGVMVWVVLQSLL